MPNLESYVQTIMRAFVERGAVSYGGEAVSQLEHALQTAWIAERAGANESLVAAALLHDLGHLLSGEAGEDIASLDDSHEVTGSRYLAGWLVRGAIEPIRLHVAAKRYLCAVDPAYFAHLSETSRHSLRAQGGPFSPAQAEEFLALPFAADAIALRRWDDDAKVQGFATPPLEHFFPAIEAALLSEA